MSWKTYQKRIKTMEKETNDSGERFVGRRYFELTEPEREEYLDYYLGLDRTFTRENIEAFERLFEEDERKIICRKRQRKPTREELGKTAADIKNFLSQELKQ